MPEETRHERDHDDRTAPARATTTGATAIEYALLAALIAGVLIGTVAALGGTVMTGLFQTASSQLASYIESRIVTDSR